MESGGVTMKRILQGRYSKEFREETVKPVVAQDLSVPELSMRLDDPKSTINNLVRASKSAELVSIEKNRGELNDTELEVALIV